MEKSHNTFKWQSYYHLFIVKNLTEIMDILLYNPFISSLNFIDGIPSYSFAFVLSHL